MKKFERIVFTSLMVLLSSIVIISGCQKNDKAANHSPEDLVYDPGSKMNYNFNDAAELKTLVEVLAKESKQIEILQANIVFVQADFCAG